MQLVNEKSKGQERASARLEKTLILLEKLKELNKKKDSKTKEKRTLSLILRIKKQRSALTKLSTKARDPITRYYANIALKEIASKTKDLF